MTVKVSPLGSQTAIVDPRTGYPTSQFMQMWQKQSQVNATILNVTTSGEVSALLDLIGSTEGSFLFRGPDQWELLESPGGTTQYLRADGVWAVPAGGGGGGGSLASLTDVSIPAPTDGQALTYDQATGKWIATGGAGAGNPPSTKWRLQLSAANGGNANTGFNGVAFRITPGGANQIPPTAPIVDSGFGSSATLPDMNPGSGFYWVMPAGAVHHIEYDYAAAISINEFSVIQANDGTTTSGPACFPQQIDVQYWDGAAWQTAWSETGLHPAFTLTPAVFTDPKYAPGGERLIDLSDVNITAPTDGQVVTWDAATSKWLAKTPTGGGGGSTGTDFEFPASTKWRMIATTNNGNGHLALDRVELFGVPGGPNLATDPTLGSVSGALSGYNQSTLWTGLDPASFVFSSVAAWAEYDFATAVSINQIALKAYIGGGAGPGAYPSNWQLQYWDGTAWQVAINTIGDTTTGDGVVKTYTNPTYGIPLLASLQDVSVGAQTDGQVLTWVAAAAKWEAKTPASGPSAASSTQWRLLFSAADNGNVNMGLNGIAFRTSIGGGNVAPIAQSSSTGGGGSVNNLPAMSPGVGSYMYWAVTSTRQWVEYDFATAIAVAEVALIMLQDGAGNGPSCFPQGFDVQYFDGTTWLTLWSETGLAPTPNSTAEIDYSPAVVPPSNSHSNPLALKWRIWQYSTNGNGLFALSGIKMMSTPGGANLSTVPAQGSVSSVYGSSHPDDLWNGSGTDFIWTTNTGQWAEYDFTVPTSINEIALTAYTSGGAGITAWPNIFAVQFQDAHGVWQTAWDYMGQTILADGVTVVFTDPDYVA